MCGVVEGAIIKSEPGTTNLCLPIAEPCGPLQTLTLNTVPHPPSSLGSVHHNSNMATAISTLCLPSGQPLTDATLLLQHPSPGPSPPTISIQEGPVDGAPHTIHISTSDSPPVPTPNSGTSHSPLPYTVNLALPNNNPLSLSALLPLHPLPPTPLLPHHVPAHSRSPLLSISEVTNTLLDHNQ